MKHIQSITDSIITNNHPFGAELQEFCQQDAHISLFPGHGFMDGGCYALAIALSDYLTQSGVDSRFFSIGRPGIIDHIVLQALAPDGALYLDGDGLATQADVIQKMSAVEGISDPELKLFFPDEADDMDVLAYAETNIPAELTKRLLAELGNFEMNRLSFEYIDELKYEMGSLAL